MYAKFATGVRNLNSGRRDNEDRPNQARSRDATLLRFTATRADFTNNCPIMMADLVLVVRDIHLRPPDVRSNFGYAN